MQAVSSGQVLPRSCPLPERPEGGQPEAPGPDVRGGSVHAGCGSEPPPFAPRAPAFFEDGVNVCVFMRPCERNANIRKEALFVKMIIARMLRSLPCALF